MTPQEQKDVLEYLRASLGLARCGLVDVRFSDAQQAYGCGLLIDLWRRVDRDLELALFRPYREDAL